MKRILYDMGPLETSVESFIHKLFGRGIKNLLYNQTTIQFNSCKANDEDDEKLSLHFLHTFAFSDGLVVVVTVFVAAKCLQNLFWWVANPAAFSYDLVHGGTH